MLLVEGSSQTTRSCIRVDAPSLNSVPAYAKVVKDLEKFGCLDAVSVQEDAQRQTPGPSNKMDICVCEGDLCNLDLKTLQDEVKKTNMPTAKNGAAALAFNFGMAFFFVVLFSYQRI